jgi:hypothetical protein
MEPKTYYVYTYAYPDPDGTVFYVGKGTGARIFIHEEDAQSGCSCRRCRCIRQIWASGKPVKKRIVYETFVEQDALLYEWILINHVHNSPSLTNIRGNLHTRRPHVKVHVPANHSQLPSTCEVEGEIYYSMYEACRRFNISSMTVKRWAQRGWVRTHKVAPQDVYYASTDLEKHTTPIPEEEWQQLRYPSNDGL